MKILVAGSHGMIGRATTKRLRELGHEVVALVRTSKVVEGEIAWNPHPQHGGVELAKMEGFDAVINVGGVAINEKRWTATHKRRLWDSRVSSTEILTKALARLEFPPKVFISASAVGYYGDRGDEVLVEHSTPGTGFLADLCQQWEGVTAPAKEHGIRVVTIRSGIVLGEGQGVLAQQVPMFKLGIGGRLGSGRQFISWISLTDEVEAIIHLLDNDELTGPFNLVAPQAIRNDEYTRVLARIVHRPAKIPAPRWMIATALGGELTDQVLLASQNAQPQRLLESGFQFEDIDLASTLDRILNHQPPADDGEVVDITDPRG